MPLLQIPEAHPSAILVREKALVIHLESIRMVITQDAVYILTVPSAMDRQVGVLPTSDAPLVKDLMLRLSMASEASNKSPATRSDFTVGCKLILAHSNNFWQTHQRVQDSCHGPSPMDACTLIVLMQSPRSVL